MLSLRSLRRHLQTPLYVNAYYLMATSAVRSLSGLPFWVIAARLYEPREVGAASALVSAVLLLATLSTLGLEVSLVRFLPQAGNHQNDMVNSSLSISVLCSTIVAGVFILAVPLWSVELKIVRQDVALLLGCVLFTAVGALSVILDQVFVAHRAARFTFYKNSLSSVLKVLLPFLLVSLSGTVALFYSIWTPVLVALLVSLLWFLPGVQRGYQPRAVVRWHLLADLTKYSLSNHAANLLVALPSAVFPLMILAALGAETNAHFYAAWTLTQPLFMVSIAVSYSLFAEGSHNKQPLAGMSASSLRINLLVLAVAISAVLLVGDKLLLVFGVTYSEKGATLLKLLSFASLPVAIKLQGLALFRIQKRLTRIMALSALDACLSIALVYWFMRPLDLNGVGLGMILSQTAVAVFVLLSARIGVTQRQAEVEQ
jgi:O-antigen/teichoic acid export membrane protein